MDLYSYVGDFNIICFMVFIYNIVNCGRVGNNNMEFFNLIF